MRVMKVICLRPNATRAREVRIQWECMPLGIRAGNCVFTLGFEGSFKLSRQSIVDKTSAASGSMTIKPGEELKVGMDNEEARSRFQLEGNNGIAGTHFGVFRGESDFYLRHHASFANTYLYFFNTVTHPPTIVNRMVDGVYSEQFLELLGKGKIVSQKFRIIEVNGVVDEKGSEFEYFESLNSLPENFKQGLNNRTHFTFRLHVNVDLEEGPYVALLFNDKCPSLTQEFLSDLVVELNRGANPFIGYPTNPA